MPAFDLRGIKIATYANNNGTVTYTSPQTAGDAMTADIEMQFAEGRLYAEGRLAEAIREATGGSISLGVKYIPDAAKKVMFGATDKSRAVSGTTVTGLEYTANDSPKYVGVAFYCPDMVDGVKKYTCVFVKKCLFSPPAMNFTTKGETIQFSTPTTVGQFLPDDSTSARILETAVVDTVAKAQAWVTAVLA